jgi:membrane protein
VVGDCKACSPRAGSHHFSMIAAGVAFYAMLSIFPALAALVSLYGLVDSPAHVQREIVELQALLPGEASGLISEQLESIVHSAHSDSTSDC